LTGHGALSETDRVAKGHARKAHIALYTQLYLMIIFREPCLFLFYPGLDVSDNINPAVASGFLCAYQAATRRFSQGKDLDGYGDYASCAT